MRAETKQEKGERKAQWMARATSHFDSLQIRKEASKMWEDANRETDKAEK